jgi:pyrimidine operon attenuation protein / uracil phosphoribosyltransferase
MYKQPMSERRNVLSKEVAEQKLQRLALEVAEQLSGDDAPLILIGVENSGTIIANKIAALLKPYLNTTVEIISALVDKNNPGGISLSKRIDFNDKNVLVINDVSNSGKTLFYVLKPLLNYYPRRVQTLVLIERMHKLFPIKPDYVGISVATTTQDYVHVEINGTEIEGAYVK